MLTIDGLALCCFNSGAKYWEVAYIRGQRHALNMTIQEFDADDQPVGDISEFPVDEGVLSFGIRLSHGSEAHFQIHPRGGPFAGDFNRHRGDNDPNDLGWMIDLAGPDPRHGSVTGLKPPGSSNRPSVTLARIRHSLLFTSEPDDNAVRLSPKSADDPSAPGSFELGRTNKEISGLLLATDPGEIIFESDPAGSLSIGPLPYDETHYYKIEIINMDEEPNEIKNGYVKGDFDNFYEVINVDGEQKDLWAIPRLSPRFFSTPDGDCNPGLLSLPTIEGLITPS